MKTINLSADKQMLFSERKYTCNLFNFLISAKMFNRLLLSLMAIAILHICVTTSFAQNQSENIIKKSVLPVVNADKWKIDELAVYKFNNSEKENKDEPTTQDLSAWEALLNGNIQFEFRPRGEFVFQNGIEDARAITNRTRLGYGTESFRGFTGYIDFINVFAFTPDHYNAAGLNDQPGHAIVADPELTVLNQFFIEYHLAKTGTHVRVGRQRIIQEDARFVGNVGWRQNEQTYDALSLQSSFGITDLRVQYDYLWQVNRIFGPHHSAGLMESNSHLVNLSYAGLPAGRLTGFIYLFDFSDAEQMSLNTYGGQIDGTMSFSNNDFSMTYLFSYGIQEPAGNNPADYTVNYYRIVSGLHKLGTGNIRFGYEFFGSDDGRGAFQTPLATLHAFQGWADKFLRTPTDGLTDINLQAGLELPLNVRFNIRHHWFRSIENDESLGREMNLSFQKQLHEHVRALMKYADFRGNESSQDLKKLWIQLQFSFQ